MKITLLVLTLLLAGCASTQSDKQKEDMKKMETVQKRATSWILNTKQLDYKERLKRLQLLPFSLYQELHVVLMFIDILNDRYNIAWTDYVQIKSNVDARGFDF